MKTRINPDHLYQSKYYTQAIATQGGQTIYISGQWAYDPKGQLIGENQFDLQTQQTFQNLKAVLEAAGASPEDVVKINLYVANYQPQLLAEIENGLTLCFGTKREFASTLIGVQALARQGMLIEVEAIAVIPRT